jgi:2-polyprenyl-3-methyl-5-hydroxy-6-metoxy-1,4-benzoquinol methylase
MFLNLGEMPPANSFLTQEELSPLREKQFPLEVYFCEQCGLVQIGYVVPPEEIFQKYIYFSSTSDLVHRHADYLAESFQKRFGLNEKTLIVEIASNDGTVLKSFKRRGIKVLGVEPAVNVAQKSLELGIETANLFFNEETAATLKQKYQPADIILGRHVFAHIPEIHGFVKGLKLLLKPGGAVVIEAPYLVDFIEKNEFDTIYHEHYSYLSVRSMAHLFKMYGMELFDVERVAIHGGSILFFIGFIGEHPISQQVRDLIKMEFDKRLDRKETFIDFAKRSERVKKDLLSLLKRLKRSGKRIAAYGAPAKGNTLLNFCGISTDLVEYTVDKSPYKQNLYTPGMHLPVYHPDRLMMERPDYVLVLAWNFLDEILEQQKRYRELGGKFIVPIPEVRIVE